MTERQQLISRLLEAGGTCNFGHQEKHGVRPVVRFENGYPGDAIVRAAKEAGFTVVVHEARKAL